MEPALRVEHQCIFYRIDVNSCFLSFRAGLLPLTRAKKPVQPPALGFRLHAVVGMLRERGDKILSAGGPCLLFLRVKGKKKLP